MTARDLVRLAAVALVATASFTAADFVPYWCINGAWPNLPCAPTPLIGDGLGAGDASCDTPRELPPGWWSARLESEEDCDAFHLVRYKGGGSALYRYLLFPPEEGCLLVQEIVNGRAGAARELCAGEIGRNGFLGTQEVVLQVWAGVGTYYVVYE